MVADDRTNDVDGDTDELDSFVVDSYWEILQKDESQPSVAQNEILSSSSIHATKKNVLELLHQARGTEKPQSRTRPTARTCRLPQTESYAPKSHENTWPNGRVVGDQMRLLALIDRGGMGEVYVAWHEGLRREVAIKVLNDPLSQDPAQVDRFRRAIQAEAMLGGHPNIAMTMSAGNEEGRHYLVTEYVNGMDLARIIERQGPLKWRDACRCIRQVALGLQHAHERGIIHRDIKPSNLIRQADGTVKILDWGLARCEVPDALSGNFTGAGVALGTFDFMSPEQASDARLADQHSDLYSLGCTLYYLLAGFSPLTGSRKSSSNLEENGNETRSSNRSQRADVPDSVGAVVNTLLQTKPSRRFASAKQLVAELDIILSEKPNRGSPVRWLAVVVAILVFGLALFARSPTRNGTDATTAKSTAISKENQQRPGRSPASVNTKPANSP